MDPGQVDSSYICVLLLKKKKRKKFHSWGQLRVTNYSYMKSLVGGRNPRAPGGNQCRYEENTETQTDSRKSNPGPLTPALPCHPGRLILKSNRKNKTNSQNVWKVNIHTPFLPNQIENFNRSPSEFKFLSRSVCARNTRKSVFWSKKQTPQAEQSQCSVLLNKKQKLTGCLAGKGQNQE